MAATLGTITTPEVSSGTLHAILKDYFLTPMQNQLNDEVVLLQLFEKAAVQWNGLQAIIPVRTARNTGVGFAGEGDNLPNAGQQTRRRLAVEAKFLYGRFELSGPAIEAARNQGMGAILSSLEDEMDRLKDDVRDHANQRLYAGARVLGFIHEHLAAGASGRQWEFCGDTTLAAAYLAEAGAAFTVSLIRMDTYAAVTGAGGAQVSLSAVDAVGSRVTLTTAGAVAINTAAVALGYPLAVVTTDAACTTKDDAALGIYDNMGEANHFGRARTDGNDTQLRGIVRSMGNTGDCSWANLTTKRIQAMFDELNIESGQEPDQILSHPRMRQEYTSLFNNNVASMALNPREAASKADLGQTGLSFNGVPWKTDRHCGRGMIIFLKTSTWKIAELAKFRFADLDGNVLSRSANSDDWGGFLRWYYNLVCIRPNANAILTGIQFDGAVDGA